MDGTQLQDFAHPQYLGIAEMGFPTITVNSARTPGWSDWGIFGVGAWVKARKLPEVARPAFKLDPVHPESQPTPPCHDMRLEFGL